MIKTSISCSVLNAASRLKSYGDENFFTVKVGRKVGGTSPLTILSGINLLSRSHEGTCKHPFEAGHFRVAFNLIMKSFSLSLAFIMRLADTHFHFYLPQEGMITMLFFYCPPPPGWDDNPLYFYCSPPPRWDDNLCLSM